MKTSYSCDKCDFTTNHKGDHEKHKNRNHEKPISEKQKMRKLNKPKEDLGIKEEVFDENDMIKMIEDATGVVRELLKVVKYFVAKKL